MFSKLFAGLILIAMIALGVSMMSGLYQVVRLIFKKDKRTKRLKRAIKMGAIFIVSYAFLNGLRFNIEQPRIWTNVYPNKIDAHIKLSTRNKDINTIDNVTHDDVNELVHNKTCLPSIVTIEATNTKGQISKQAYLHAQHLKEKVQGNKPSAKTRGHITHIRYGMGESTVTWYGLTINTGDVPLLDLDVEYEPSTGTSPNTLFETH